MGARFSTPAFAFLTSLPLAGNGAAAATLRIAGAGGIFEAMRQIVARLTAAARVNGEATGGFGTVGAMRALNDGVLAALLPKPNALRSGDIPSSFAADDPEWANAMQLKIIPRTKVGADAAIVGQVVTPAPRFARTTPLGRSHPEDYERS